MMTSWEMKFRCVAEELTAQFGIAGILDFEETEDGLSNAAISLDGVAGELYLQGAQLTAWQLPNERPVLFTSPRSAFAPGRAIRRPRLSGTWQAGYSFLPVNFLFFKRPARWPRYGEAFVTRALLLRAEAAWLPSSRPFALKIGCGDLDGALDHASVRLDLIESFLRARWGATTIVVHGEVIDAAGRPKWGRHRHPVKGAAFAAVCRWTGT